MDANPHRLPRTVVPSHYRLRIEPDLDRSSFAGTVSIDVEVVETVSEVVLNAVDLDIGPAVLRTTEKELGVVEVVPDEQAQRAALRLERPAPPGSATLDIEFAGVLNDHLQGFYRSTFVDVDGTTRVIATTQFESTDARRAFPCFDEPDLKASFGVTLVVDERLLAVSNGAEIERCEAGEGKVAVTFADTIPMSTYLVAFVVGPFEATDPVDVDGVPLRVVFPPGKAHLTGYPLECGEFCLRYLRDYYDIPYPGDKIDLVAIPDFAYGAMENLGCVTFRETALLLDPATATQGELARILDVVGHELAHMWFGDLVTMRWWDGIWLNEAFATFMELKATDARRPEWKRWLSFAAEERPWALRVDALASTRPVEFEVRSPDEADQMFDALTYGKGSAVLRMMEQHLGEEVFRQGVGDYLRRHARANTVTADLWASLEAASGTAAGRVMDTWILQGGYPQLEVVTVEGGVRLRQRRFLSIPDEGDDARWQVPVGIRGESDGIPFSTRLLMVEDEQTVPIDGPIDWLIANAGGHGYYRVAYAPTLHKALLARLDELDAIERYVTIDDAWAFVESGGLDAAGYVELASAYRHETEPAVWQAVLGGMGAIRHHLVEDRDLEVFGHRVAELVTPAFERLGWAPGPEESDLTRRLRGILVGALGRLADEQSVIERSRELAAEWLDDPRSVDPDVGQAALFNAAAHGDLDLYQRLFEAYRRADAPQHELRLLQASTVFDLRDTVDRMLDAILDGSIRSQDSAWVVARLLGGRRSGEHAWERVREGWSQLTGRIPPRTLRRVVEGIPALSRPEVAGEVESFLSEVEIPAGKKAVAQNLERLRVNVLLRKRERPTFVASLRAR